MCPFCFVLSLNCRNFVAMKRKRSFWARRVRTFSLILMLGVLGVITSCGSAGKDGRKVVRGTNDLKGAVIGVQLGTTSDILATNLESKGGGTKVERYTKGADAIQALSQGKIDCVVTDEAPAKAFQRVNPSLKILPQEFDKSSMAICVAKDNEPLLRLLDEAIHTLQEQGTIDTIVARHMVHHQSVPYHSPKDVKYIDAAPLKFATNATFEPFEYYQAGQIVGIDVDVAHAIGDLIGRKVEVTDMEFDAIITSVQTGKADAGIAGITVTEERKKNISFTIPYTEVKQVVVVHTGENAAVLDTGFIDHFKSCFITDGRYQYLLTGLGNTLIITFFAILLSLALGTLIAIVRATHDRNGNHRILNLLCQFYLTIIRGTPTMVQLLIIYYVVFASANVDKIFVAIIAFGLNSAAYISEVIRSGIMSVDKGQMEAGRSLGLSYSQTMRLVILPQAFKNVLPAMGNELITLLKETSISGYIGLVDLTKGSDIIRSITYDAMMPLGVVALIYLGIVLALSAGVARLEKQLRKGER